MRDAHPCMREGVVVGVDDGAYAPHLCGATRKGMAWPGLARPQGRGLAKMGRASAGTGGTGASRQVQAKRGAYGRCIMPLCIICGANECGLAIRRHRERAFSLGNSSQAGDSGSWTCSELGETPRRGIGATRAVRSAHCNPRPPERAARSTSRRACTDMNLDLPVHPSCLQWTHAPQLMPLSSAWFGVTRSSGTAPMTALVKCLQMPPGEAQAPTDLPGAQHQRCHLKPPTSFVCLRARTPRACLSCRPSSAHRSSRSGPALERHHWCRCRACASRLFCQRAQLWCGTRFA